jgi:L-fuconolactonase
MRIDAHQHFWYYSAGMEWITPAMSVIRKDFGPDALIPHLREHGFDGSIAVQAATTMEETNYLLQLAEEHAFIKGVVGWIDFEDPAFDAQLEGYSTFKALKGFRHILQAQPPEHMLGADFIAGLHKIKQAGYAYDLLVYPTQLSAVLELLKKCPGQRFVIDHLAKPSIRTETTEGWATQMKEIAAFENVYCKLSGMVTEADWKNWQHEDFISYLDTVSEAFGTNRLMFGSDWPVCLVAGSYDEVVRIIENYFSADEQDAVFGNTAVSFYQLT